MTEKVLLWEMTYEEAREAFKEADFIVLPTGSIEQHSIHLPLSTDSIRAEEFTKHLVRKSRDLKLIMLPTLYYGQSNHHIHFPGTLTLSEDTYIKVLKEIAWSVKQHGGKRLFILNFHGGNNAPINVARNMIELSLTRTYKPLPSLRHSLSSPALSGTPYFNALTTESVNRLALAIFWGHPNAKWYTFGDTFTLSTRDHRGMSVTNEDLLNKRL